MKKIECLAKHGRLISYLLLALAAMLPVSCSKRTEREPVFPVTGKLVDGGQPAEKAVMFFHPAGQLGFRYAAPGGQGCGRRLLPSQHVPGQRRRAGRGIRRHRHLAQDPQGRSGRRG